MSRFLPSTCPVQIQDVRDGFSVYHQHGLSWTTSRAQLHTPVGRACGPLRPENSSEITYYSAASREAHVARGAGRGPVVGVLM